MRAFVIAMDDEAEAVRAAAKPGDLFLVSGIGKVNAAAATQKAIDQGATEIVNAGLSGGFGADVKVGGVYEVSRAVEYDFDLAQLNHTAIGVLNERTTPYIPMATKGLFPTKTLATGDHFNDREDDYHLITEVLGAELRDMEGAAIAHVCEKNGITCRAIKCVTNVAGGGSMVGQFEENRRQCLAILSDAIRTYLAG